MEHKCFSKICGKINFVVSVPSFAFVEFESTDDAKDALENLNNTEIEGRTIRLEFSQSGGGRDGGRGSSGTSSKKFLFKLSSVQQVETRCDEKFIIWKYMKNQMIVKS